MEIVKHLIITRKQIVLQCALSHTPMLRTVYTFACNTFKQMKQSSYRIAWCGIEKIQFP